MAVAEESAVSVEGHSLRRVSRFQNNGFFVLFLLRLGKGGRLFKCALLYCTVLYLLERNVCECV